MTTYRIIRRRSLTGTELFKVQKKGWFWWTDVTQIDDHEGLITTSSTIWFRSLYDARHWISLQADECDLVIETIRAL